MESRCLLCCSESLKDIPEGQGLPGVTSDSKPWPRAGAFRVCRHCGHVQKHLSPQWLADIDRIYAAYEMYTASGGGEQAVFQGEAPAPRSVRLLEAVLALTPLPSTGRLLDVGCGNGAFLRSFGARLPEWELYGHEPQANRCESILTLPGVKGFLHGPIEELTGGFDVVSMLHVIEHLLDPVQTLRTVFSMLRPGGLLLIQAPNLAANPFDLPVTDHCSHFTLDMLEYAARLAGFGLLASSDAWIQKEVGVLALRPELPAPMPENHASGPGGDLLSRHLSWLVTFAGQARNEATRSELGIFGTSNAATWLTQELNGEVQFFVDEDPRRHGNTHLGRPILAPADVPPGCAVYLAFPRNVAEGIRKRLGRTYPELRLILPPAA